MIQTALIQNAHSDLVTDAAYDVYGLHLATCSLDQRIKIWKLEQNTGNWLPEDDWKAHEAAITKVSWAHPEFGTVLASASFDRTVKVWEQVRVGSAPQVNGNAPSSSGSKWVERNMFVEAKGSVRGLEFAPHHFGLKFATIASDNFLRVYECLDPSSLKQWQMTDDVDVLALPSTSNSISSVVHSVATATPTQTSAPFDNQSVSMASSLLAAQQQTHAPHRPGLGAREADGGWCLSWCKERYWGEVVAVGCGISGVVKIIQLSASSRPLIVLSLDPRPTPSPPATGRPSTPSRTAANPPPGAGPGQAESETIYSLTSVAWAPSCGRSYHLVATGSRDGKVRIWKVRPPPPIDEQDQNSETVDEKWTANLVAEFDDHMSTVGRVEWNITGTILSSAGNDGRVRFWKQTMGSVWRPAGQISVEQAEESMDGADVDMDRGAHE